MNNLKILTQHTYHGDIEKVFHVNHDEIKPYLCGKKVGPYFLGSTIGEGSFAKVKEGIHSLTGEKVAIKMINKKKSEDDRYISRNLYREARIMSKVQHPNIVGLLEVIETDSWYYLITELCTGGELLDYICSKNQLSEEVTKKFIYQLVSGVFHLHSKGIVHRDLKIENFLLDENENLKLIDFGLSNTLSMRSIQMWERTGIFPQLLVTHCGSPAYAAPELLAQKSYGPQVDVWSIGVNMFAMLTGSLPYSAEPFNVMDIYEKMMNKKMNSIPSHLSADCKDLLRRFLEPHADKRITLLNALRHPWLSEQSRRSQKQFSYHSIDTKQDVDDRILLFMSERLDLSILKTLKAIEEKRPTHEAAIYRLLKTKLDRYLHTQPLEYQRTVPEPYFNSIKVVKKAKLLSGRCTNKERAHPRLIYRGIKIDSKRSRSQPSIDTTMSTEQNQQDNFTYRDRGVSLHNDNTEDNKSCGISNNNYNLMRSDCSTKTAPSDDIQRIYTEHKSVDDELQRKKEAMLEAMAKFKEFSCSPEHRSTELLLSPKKHDAQFLFDDPQMINSVTSKAVTTAHEMSDSRKPRPFSSLPSYEADRSEQYRLTENADNPDRYGKKPQTVCRLLRRRDANARELLSRKASSDWQLSRADESKHRFSKVEFQKIQKVCLDPLPKLELREWNDHSETTRSSRKDTNRHNRINPLNLSDIRSDLHSMLDPGSMKIGMVQVAKWRSIPIFINGKDAPTKSKLNRNVITQEGEPASAGASTNEEIVSCNRNRAPGRTFTETSTNRSLSQASVV